MAVTESPSTVVPIMLAQHKRKQFSSHRRSQYLPQLSPSDHIKQSETHEKATKTNRLLPIAVSVSEMPAQSPAMANNVTRQLSEPVSFFYEKTAEFELCPNQVLN